MNKTFRNFIIFVSHQQSLIFGGHNVTSIYRLSPWILYWSFSGPGLWTIAILGRIDCRGGIGHMALVQTPRYQTMEVVTMAYFAIHAIVTLALGSSF